MKYHHRRYGRGNDAKYGNGICVDGNISLNIGNIEIASNEAINGGGVCLMNNAQMTFSEGQIRVLPIL